MGGCHAVVKTLPSNAVGVGSIPAGDAKIPYASWPKDQTIKQKQYCNKFNKDFKNGPHQEKNLKKKYQMERAFDQWAVCPTGHMILPLFPQQTVLKYYLYIFFQWFSWQPARHHILTLAMFPSLIPCTSPHFSSRLY